MKTFLLLSILGATALIANAAPRVVSQYRSEERKIGRLDVDHLTAAPLQIVMQVRVNLAPAETFDLVSRQLPKWISAVPHVNWDHSGSATAGQCDAGSVRRCAFGNDEIIEQMKFWQEGQIYAYSVDAERSTAPFPIKNHLGVFIVESDGAGGSLLTWRQYFNRKFSLMAPMAGWGMRRIMKPALNHLIELHGGEFLEPAA